MALKIFKSEQRRHTRTSKKGKPFFAGGKVENIEKEDFKIGDTLYRKSDNEAWKLVRRHGNDKFNVAMAVISPIDDANYTIHISEKELQSRYTKNSSEPNVSC